MTNSKLGKVISIVSSALIVLIGIAFIASAAHLYFTGGDTPYSREKVGDYLAVLLVPSLLTLAFVVWGFIYNAVTREKQDDGFKRSESEMLQGYSKRFSIDALSPDVKNSVLAERKSRQTANIVFRSVSALFSAAAVFYLIFIPNYSVENLNGDVILALAFVLPALAVALLAEFSRTLICERSAARERALLLEAVKSGYKIAPPIPEETSNIEKRASLAVKYTLLVVAALFIVIGIFNGGMADVLDKAVKICTECIGLG